MADSSFGTNDPRTQTKWSRDVFKYALQNVRLMPLMGRDGNDAIHTVMDLDNDEAGDTIVIKSRDPLSGAGQGDDGNTTGNEEALRRRNMSIVVHERSHSTVSAGAISEKRTDTKFRSASRLDLGEWWGEQIENDLITSAAGLYNENASGAAIETINESYPTSDRIYYGGQSAAGTLGNSGADYTTDALMTAGTQTDNLMGTVHLSAQRRRFISVAPRPRPVNVRDESRMNADDIRNGVSTGPLMGKYFIVLLHPLQIKAIKAETGATGWAQMTAAAQVRGDKNPIFAGAEFLWDSMICWEYDRIPLRTGANGTTLPEGFALNAGRTATSDACANGRSVARALMLGAQGVTFAWGKRMTWYEDMVDASKPKVKVLGIYGVKRTLFNAHGGSTAGSDEAIWCMDTEVVLDA